MVACSRTLFALWAMLGSAAAKRIDESATDLAVGNEDFSSAQPAVVDKEQLDEEADILRALAVSGSESQEVDLGGGESDIADGARESAEDEPVPDAELEDEELDAEDSGSIRAALSRSQYHTAIVQAAPAPREEDVSSTAAPALTSEEASQREAVSRPSRERYTIPLKREQRSAKPPLNPSEGDSSMRGAMSQSTNVKYKIPRRTLETGKAAARAGASEDEAGAGEGDEADPLMWDAMSRSTRTKYSIPVGSLNSGKTAAVAAGEDEADTSEADEAGYAAYADSMRKALSRSAVHHSSDELS